LNWHPNSSKYLWEINNFLQKIRLKRLNAIISYYKNSIPVQCLPIIYCEKHFYLDQITCTQYVFANSRPYTGYVDHKRIYVHLFQTSATFIERNSNQKWATLLITVIKLPYNLNAYEGFFHSLMCFGNLKSRNGLRSSLVP
jgi:hypothetical protein